MGSFQKHSSSTLWPSSWSNKIRTPAHGETGDLISGRDETRPDIYIPRGRSAGHWLERDPRRLTSTIYNSGSTSNSLPQSAGKIVSATDLDTTYPDCRLYRSNSSGNPGSRYKLPSTKVYIYNPPRWHSQSAHRGGPASGMLRIEDTPQFFSLVDTVE